MGALNDARLFSKCYLGTKKLIEEYQQEVVSQLKYVCADKDFDERSKAEFVNDTRQSFGSSALVLTGGTSFALFHLGVVKALNDHHVLPRIINGASVGALVASLVCIHSEEELPQVLHPSGIDLEAFSSKGTKGTISRKIARLLKHGYLLDVKVLEAFVRTNVGDITFEEAYRKTRRILVCI